VEIVLKTYKPDKAAEVLKDTLKYATKGHKK